MKKITPNRTDERDSDAVRLIRELAAQGASFNCLANALTKTRSFADIRRKLRQAARAPNEPEMAQAEACVAAQMLDTSSDGPM